MAHIHPIDAEAFLGNAELGMGKEVAERLNGAAENGSIGDLNIHLGGVRCLKVLVIRVRCLERKGGLFNF